MKHSLQIACENAELSVRSYSGRGMYGRTCLGVTLGGDIGNAVADIFLAMAHTASPSDMEEVADAFRGMQTDSMGRGTIMYFPGIEFSDSDE